MEGGTAPRWGIRYPRFDFSCQGNQACVPGTHGSARQVCVVTGKPGGRTEMLPWWVPLVSLTNRLSTGATGFKAAGPTESAKCPCSLQLFAWLISHQPAVLFSQNKPATSNQPAVLFSQNKPAPTISQQPTERACVAACCPRWLPASSGGDGELIRRIR
jgi:hypothetical protein